MTDGVRSDIPDIVDDLPPFIRRGNPFATVGSLEALIKTGMTEMGLNDRKGRIYSSTSAHCARQTMLYSTVTESVVMGPTAKAYIEIGNAIEKIILDALDAERALLFAGYRVMDIGVNMGGKVDAIAYVGGKVIGLEIKSCGALPTNPKMEHAAQALMYQAVTGIPFSVVYMSRNVADYKQRLQLRELPLNATPEETLTALFNVCYAYLCIQEGVIPRMPPFESAASCGWCNFRENCWEGKPFDGVMITPELHAKLTLEAKTMAEDLNRPEAIKNRRNGLFKFLSRNGTPHARKVFAEREWDELV